MTNIAPWLSVSNATQALDFYKAAFAATELERHDDDDGDAVVAQLSIDGADFWVQDDVDSSPESVDGRWIRMILTVDDPDTVFANALAAGATEVFAMYEEHGWRLGRIADPYGHHWEIGRRLTA
jgi:PhnB protein